MQGNVTHFEDYYDYIKPLGCGSFGFVVSAIDKASGEHVALKVNQKFLTCCTDCRHWQRECCEVHKARGGDP